MPPQQRAFLAAREAAPSLRAAALAAGPGGPLRASYDVAVAELSAFRVAHRNFAAAYIAQHAARGDEKGTGGSAFMPALAGYQRQTARAKLSGAADSGT